MKLNHVTFGKLLLPIGLLFAALVIVGGTLQWSVPVVYALTALMFAAIFGDRAIERRERRER